MSEPNRPTRTGRNSPSPILEDVAFLRRMLAASSDCIKVLDLDANLLAMNEGGQRVLEIAELTPHLGTCWTGWWTGPQRDAALAAVAEAKAGGTGRFEANANTFGGTPKWWDVTVSAIPGPDGRPERLLSVSRDITSQRIARDAAAERADRLSSVLESAKDYAVISVDLNGLIDGWSTGAAGTFGWSEAAAVGRPFDLIWTPEDLAGGSPGNELKKAEIEGVAPDNRWHVRADGTRIFVVGATRPVRDAGGTLTGYVKVCRDETEREATGHALRQSEESFRQLADTLPQIVWAARPDGVLDYYNRRWFRFIGQENETDSATNAVRWDQYVHPEDLTRAGTKWAESLGTGNPYAIEFRVRDGAGTYHWFLVRALAVRNDSGQIIRWYGTCTDIDDQKAMEADRQALLDSERAARSEAERAGRMKDDFLATLSHELRTPLNAIVGWSQILASTASEPQELTEGLAVIERNARAQAQIIDDILDMSRIVAGKIRLDVQEVDLATIVRAGVETVQPAADAKGILLRTTLDPAASGVVGDPNRLHQVFWNLISNAAKFTPKGGRVHVVLARVDSHVEVSVIDTGEGIDAAFLPHVFDRFRQADGSTTRRHGGLGLGLSIVKQLVELHGGSVRVKSPGKGLGATFIVTLPLTPVHAETEASASPRQHPKDGSVRGEPVRNEQTVSCGQLDGVNILAVDDEPDGRLLIKRLLEECGAVVRTAGSAEEAMALIAADVPDVVISDIGMPGEDGYTLMRRIRALPPTAGGGVFSLALTAYARAADRVRALEAGFQMHLTKPVDRSELIATVAALAKLATPTGKPDGSTNNPV